MIQSARYILSIGAGIGSISILYFISLLASLPFWLILPLTAVALYFLLRWMNKQTFGQEEPIGRFRFYVLAVCVLIIINKVYYIALPHGGWDAFAIWNMNAKFLADPQHWRNIFLNTQFGHPDYPLALPATLAFFARLTGGLQMLIPFAFHFLITLCIPLLIFLEVQRRSIFISALVLILFSTNEFYLAQGMNQYADTLLAFFFLCALVCMEHHKEDTRMLVLSAAFLGLCMWTKNEGLILAIIFTLFHLKEFFGRYRVQYSLIGIAIPLIAFLIFKLAFAPPSDMLEKQRGDIRVLLLDKQRYVMVYNHFMDNLKYFRDVKWGMLIYLLICAIRKRNPDKRLTMLLTCLFVYMGIYIVTPNDLEWHLLTSQDRLMHQLMPAMMYVLAVSLSGDGSTKPVFQARFFSDRQRLQ